MNSYSDHPIVHREATVPHIENDYFMVILTGVPFSTATESH